MHLEPHFPTYFSPQSLTNPDIIFPNKHHYFNCICEPGSITTSDHLSLSFLRNHFLTDKPQVYQIYKADWDRFQLKLDSHINVTNYEGNNAEQLENATKKWIRVIKSAMDSGIPKSTHQYTYQIKTTLDKGLDKGSILE